MKPMIIDAHQDLFWSAHHTEERFLKQTNIEMIKRNLKIVHLSIYLDESEVQGANLKQVKDGVFRQLHWYRELIENDRHLMLIEHANDVHTLLERKEVTGVILHYEGGEAIDSSHFVHRLAALGVRSIGLVWNWKNLLASPAKNDDGEGLSSLGRDVVYRMMDEGMLIDTAHLNESGVVDVHEICKKSSIPFINTHANCRGVQHHVRNVSDEQLRMLKDVNGIMGITAVSTFSTSEKPVDTSHVIAHVKYAVEHMGVSHVGLGTDFGAIFADPISDFGTLDDMHHFTHVLHGEFNESQTEQILWHNWRNLYRRVLK